MGVRSVTYAETAVECSQHGALTEKLSPNRQSTRITAFPLCPSPANRESTH